MACSIAKRSQRRCTSSASRVSHLLLPWPSRYASVRLFDVFDIDGNGEIDLKEFTVGLVCLVTGSKRDKLKSLFQVCVVRRWPQLQN